MSICAFLGYTVVLLKLLLHINRTTKNEIFVFCFNYNGEFDVCKITVSNTLLMEVNFMK